MCCFGACSNGTGSSDSTSLAEEIGERRCNSLGKYVEWKTTCYTSTSSIAFRNSSSVDDVCMKSSQPSEADASGRGTRLGPEPSLSMAPCTFVPSEPPPEFLSSIDLRPNQDGDLWSAIMHSDGDGSEHDSLSQTGDLWHDDDSLLRTEVPMATAMVVRAALEASSTQTFVPPLALL